MINHIQVPHTSHPYLYTTSEPCEFQQPTVAYVYETKTQLYSRKVPLAHTHNSNRQPIVVVLNAKKNHHVRRSKIATKIMLFMHPTSSHSSTMLVIPSFFSPFTAILISNSNQSFFALIHMKNSALIPLPVQKQFALTFFFVLVL